MNTQYLIEKDPGSKKRLINVSSISKLTWALIISAASYNMITRNTILVFSVFEGAFQLFFAIMVVAKVHYV